MPLLGTLGRASGTLLPPAIPDLFAPAPAKPASARSALFRRASVGARAVEMGKPFDILQMLIIHVVGRRIAAERAAAQREGRYKSRGDSGDALRAGRIDENPASRHRKPEAIRERHRPCVDDGGVTAALLDENAPAQGKGLLLAVNRE